jgi:hypothetical protein
MRRFFFEAWRKYRGNQPLEPLEAQIVHVIAIHPEYHGIVEDADNLERDYTPEEGETNPFMHMGMHLALRDQSMTDQPAGVRDLYLTLMQKFGGDHEAEHQMMECLGEMLWTAQRSGSEPDADAYLECLKQRSVS